MERLRYVDTEVTQDEKTLLSNVLAAALPGLERLLGEDRHDILKGKIRYNSIGISFNGGRDDKVRQTFGCLPNLPLNFSHSPHRETVQKTLSGPVRHTALRDKSELPSSTFPAT
jgi:hypothetical protein